MQRPRDALCLLLSLAFCFSPRWARSQVIDEESMEDLGPVDSFALSPDGTVLVTVHEGKVVRYATSESDTGAAVGSVDGWKPRLVVSPSGAMVAITTESHGRDRGKLTVLDLTAKDVVRYESDCGPYATPDDPVFSVDSQLVLYECSGKLFAANPNAGLQLGYWTYHGQPAEVLGEPVSQWTSEHGHEPPTTHLAPGMTNASEIFTVADDPRGVVPLQSTIRDGFAGARAYLLRQNSDFDRSTTSNDGAVIVANTRPHQRGVRSVLRVWGSSELLEHGEYLFAHEGAPRYYDIEIAWHWLVNSWGAWSVSPDGRFVLLHYWSPGRTASLDERPEPAAIVIDVSQNRIVQRLEIHSRVPVVWSGDGRYLFALQGGHLKRWERSGGLPLLELGTPRLGCSTGPENRTLESYENACIEIDLSNTGRGPAYNVVVRAEAPADSGIEVDPVPIPVLRDDQFTTVHLPIRGVHVSGADVEVRISVHESRGVGAAPVDFAVQTTQVEPPVLRIGTDATVLDDLDSWDLRSLTLWEEGTSKRPAWISRTSGNRSGVLGNGETAIVEFPIHNDGAGWAYDVFATVETTDDVEVLQGFSQSGDIPPNGNGNARGAIEMPRFWEQDHLTLDLVVEDVRPAFAAVKRSISVPVERHLPTYRATTRFSDGSSPKTSGDGDGAPEPGELVRMAVVVENAGDIEARDLNMRVVVNPRKIDIEADDWNVDLLPVDGRVEGEFFLFIRRDAQLVVGDIQLTVEDDFVDRRADYESRLRGQLAQLVLDKTATLERVELARSRLAKERDRLEEERRAEWDEDHRYVDVTFSFCRRKAKTVHLAGSFNDWAGQQDAKISDDSYLMAPDPPLGDGCWARTERLEERHPYHFAFIVNGKRWIADRDQPGFERREVPDFWRPPPDVEFSSFRTPAAEIPLFPDERIPTIDEDADSNLQYLLREVEALDERARQLEESCPWPEVTTLDLLR